MKESHSFRYYLRHFRLQYNSALQIKGNLKLFFFDHLQPF